jgi:hypothetical protein
MMETKQYTTIDKSEWNRGPWDNEPDKLQWQDEATGLPCLIVRGPHGALCGYVGVAEGHKYFGKDYNDVDVEVHCGLTFGNMCQAGADEDTHICHVPGPGEPDHVWWLGFDCAHAGDRSPGYEHLTQRGGPIPCSWNTSGFEEYRELPYVKNQVAALARQLAS